MPDIYENEQKQDVEISGPSQGETVLYPHVIGQSARESFTEYANPRLEELAVSPDENIQDALKGLEARGGGILRLRSGTYRVNYPITVPSNVKLIGENESTTIIDFLSTSANISFEGTNIYTTGTISSISGGTTVTGSSTAWLPNVTTNHQLFIDEQWYRIAAITGDTTIVLAEPYKEAATFSGTYRAVILKTDIYIENVTLTNSTGTAIVGTDIRRIYLQNVTMLTNNKGFVFTNFSFLLLGVVTSVDSTSNGYELTNGVFFNASQTIATGGDAHGAVANNIRLCVWNLCATTANATDGLNATDMTTSLIILESSGNTGQGIEFVSGCNLNRIEATNANANTSDGIKLTATSDNNIIAGAIVRSNGGYGINIAAASCDNNVIITPVGGGNTSGNINDSGTGTITILSSATGTGITKSYTAGQAITANQAVFLEDATPFYFDQFGNSSATGETNNGFGRATDGGDQAHVKVAQSFQEASAYSDIAKIRAKLFKTGTPVDNAVITIETDNAGEPSGTVLATATKSGGSLDTTPTNYDLDLDVNISLTANTKYWVVFSRSGAGSDTNYYLTRGNTSSQYANGAAADYNGTSWSTDTFIADNHFFIIEESQSGDIYI